MEQTPYTKNLVGLGKNIASFLMTNRSRQSESDRSIEKFERPSCVELQPTPKIEACGYLSQSPFVLCKQM